MSVHPTWWLNLRSWGCWVSAVLVRHIRSLTSMVVVVVIVVVCTCVCMYQHACTMVYNWFLPSTLFPGILSFYCFLLFCTPGYLVWDFRWFSCLRLPVHFRNTGFQHVHHIWLLHMFWGLDLKALSLVWQVFLPDEPSPHLIDILTQGFTELPRQALSWWSFCHDLPRAGITRLHHWPDFVYYFWCVTKQTQTQIYHLSFFFLEHS